MVKLIFITFLFFLSNPIFALECPEGQYLVKPYIRTSYYRSDGTYVSSAQVEAYCREYTFSKPLVLKYLEKMPEGWPYKLELFKTWNSSEKKLLEKELSKVPKALRDQGEIKFLRAIRSTFPDNPSTSAPDESIIVFYDGAQKFGYKRVLAHELAHLLYSKLDKNALKSYYDSAGWKETSKNKFTTARTTFSEHDGVLGPEEDFANNIEHIVSDKNFKNILDNKIINCINSILGNVK